MSRRRKDKGLRIRVIGLHESCESDATPSAMTRGSVIHLSLDDLLASNFTDEYADEQQPLWIQVEHATPADVERIGEHFGLHPLTVEGVQSKHTREKLEIFQNYLFLVFHALHGRGIGGGSGGSHDARYPSKGMGAFGSSRAHLGADDGPDSKMFESAHEGSRLLAQDTAKYYGGNTDLSSHRMGAMPAQSPLPPRRHKSHLNLTGNSLLPHSAAPTPSPQPTPTRSRNERPVVTHVDRFQLPYPLGMGPDDLSPSGSSSGTSGASDTSASEDEQSTASTSPEFGATSPLSAPSSLAHSFLDDVNRASSQVASPAISHAVASLAREGDALRTNPIKLVVFPHLVLSFHSSGLDTVVAVRNRLSRVYADNVESTAWIIHALLDSITDSLLPVVNGTAMEVDALEELIYVLSGSEHRDLLKRMGMTRRRLTFLRQRLWSKRDILMSLIGKDWQVFLAGVQIPYLRDVYDHVVTMLHKVESASDLLASLQNTYLANVQIDVAEASNDQNDVMKNLTAVGSIILPMQLVAGLWGMNCAVPFQKDLRQTWDAMAPFVSVCIGMALVTIFMTVYFRRTNLL